MRDGKHSPMPGLRQLIGQHDITLNGFCYCNSLIDAREARCSMNVSLDDVSIKIVVAFFCSG